MWRVTAASVIGTSHTVTGTPCEDSCYAQVETIAGKPPLLVVFVADGAGSASRGGRGAELAVEAAIAFFSSHYSETPECVLDPSVAVACIQAVQAKIAAEAFRFGRVPRDYACTFLGVVSSPVATLIMQVGDGGIVVDVGNGLEVPIVPMSGEYANMTTFVTDDNAVELLAVMHFARRADKVAVFSDGMQRLVLNLATNTAHKPFFSPLFSILAKATAEQECQLEEELRRFLQSEAVNERSDDDKTLALAHWIDEVSDANDTGDERRCAS